MKQAILVKGETPNAIEDIAKFWQAMQTDIDAISAVSGQEDYSVHVFSPIDMVRAVKEIDSRDKLLFYFVGHGNHQHLDNISIYTNDVLRAMEHISTKKFIVLDTCSRDRDGRLHLNELEVPANSRLITAQEGYSSRSAAKVLHDLVVTREQKLDDVDADMLRKFNYNWFEVLER